MAKDQIWLNLETLEDTYRHYHDAFEYIISKHRQHLVTNNYIVVIFDNVTENDKKVKKIRKEFETTEAYNNWLDEHYPSNWEIK